MEYEKNKLLNSYLQQQAAATTKPTKLEASSARPTKPQTASTKPTKPTKPETVPAKLTKSETTPAAKPAESIANETKKYSLVKGDFKEVATPPSQEKVTNVVRDGPTGLITLDDITLEDFKNYVKKWLEVDAYLKKAMELVKEKKKQRNKLAELITRFMCKYNIEDLNTKEGRIRCKTSYIREPVTQKVIKAKMTELLPERKDIVTKIYEERPKHERLSLKRLKITSG